MSDSLRDSLYWHPGKQGWALPEDDDRDPPRPRDYPYIFELKTEAQLDWFVKHNPPKEAA
jgi:hypothetical protein